MVKIKNNDTCLCLRFYFDVHGLHASGDVLDLVSKSYDRDLVVGLEKRGRKEILGLVIKCQGNSLSLLTM